MSNSVFRVTEADDVKESITLIVSEDGSVTPDKETVQTYLSTRPTADINLMRMKKVEAGRLNVTLDTLTYVNSDEIEDPEEMDEIARNLFNFRMDHDYTPFTTPTHESQDDMEDELAHTLSMLEQGCLPQQQQVTIPEVETFTKITKIVKGKKQTILVTNKQKAKMIKTGLLKPIPEDLFKKPKAVVQKITRPVQQVPEIVSQQQAEETSDMEDEEEDVDDDFMEDVDDNVDDDDDSDFELEEESDIKASKSSRPMRTRRKPQVNNVKAGKTTQRANKASRQKAVVEKIESEASRTTDAVEVPKTIDKKPIPKKEKKAPKPMLDDFALFSTPDIIRRVGKEAITTPTSPDKPKPAKISPDNRSKSTADAAKSRRLSVESKSPDKNRRLSLEAKTKTNQERFNVEKYDKKRLEDQVQVQEFSETLSNSNESIGDTDEGLEPLPSAEDIRAIIQNENIKSFTSSLVIPDPGDLPPLPPLQPITYRAPQQPATPATAPMQLIPAPPSRHHHPPPSIESVTMDTTPPLAHPPEQTLPAPVEEPEEEEANQMSLEATGLDLDQSILDNINTDLISEDILYQVAQSLVDNTELQNAIDKSIVDGQLVLDASLTGGDDLSSVQDLHSLGVSGGNERPPQVIMNHLMRPQERIKHVADDIAAAPSPPKHGTHIVRSDGRVVVIPPIERPTTRSRNKRKDDKTSSPMQRSNKPVHKPLDDQHVSGNELDSSNDEEDESEDDPNKLWCICNQPHNNRFMICCDTCEEWYHGKCVNVTKVMGQNMEAEGKEWICVYCRDKSLRRPKAAARRIRKASRTSTDSGGGGDRGGTTPSPKKAPPPPPVLSSSSSTASLTMEERRAERRAAAASSASAPGCVVCSKPTRSSSIYCSDVCILKHAQGVEKVVVFDRKSGRLLSGNDAPSAANLDKWLAMNPSYEVVRSTNKLSQNNKPASFTQSKLRIIKNQGNDGVSLAVHKKGVNIGVLAHSPKHGTPQTANSNKHSPKKITGLKIISKQVSLNQSQNKIKLVPAPPINPRPVLTSTASKPKLVQTKLVSTTSSTSSTSSTSNSKDATSSTNSGSSKDKQPMPTKTPKARQAEVNTAPIAATASKENLRDTVKKTFNEQLTNRLRKCDDLKLSDDDVKNISSEIESQLYKCFGDTGQKYKNKYRSLIFNIKDAKNQTLWRRICEKAVNPYQLVRLSPDDLASQELALWREREAKHQLDMIKKSELELLNCSRQYVFKTHKGEQVLEDERPNDTVTDVISGLGADSTSTTSDHHFPHDETDKKPSSSSSAPSSKHGSRDKSRDRRSSKEKSKEHKKRSRSKERNSRHRGEKKRSRSRDKHRNRSSHPHHKSSRHKKELSSSTMSSINTDKLDKKSKEILELLVDKHIVPPLEDNLWKHVPQEDFVIPPPVIESDSDHEPSSTVTIPTPPRTIDPEEAPPITAQATKDQPGEPQQSEDTMDSGGGKSPPLPPSKLEPIWQGSINMVDVAQISITAQEVSGECHGLGEELPASLDIVGRISSETVWDYIGKMKSSNSKTISVLRLTATNMEERMPYLALYSYLHSRKRLGVVKSVTKAVKDFYILPLAAHTPIPDALLPIAGPGFDDPRTAMLVGILVRDKRKRPHSSSSAAADTHTHSPVKRVRVDIVRSSTPPPPPAPTRSYTPPPSRDPRIKPVPGAPPLPPPLPSEDAPSPTPSPEQDEDDDDEDNDEEYDEDMDEPYSPEDSDPDDDAMPSSESVDSRLNANDISNLLTGSVKSSSFLDSGISAQTFEPFTNKYTDQTIPGLDNSPPPCPTNSDELQRKMAELDQRIAAQKAEIDKVSQDLVSSASSAGGGGGDIGSSSLANIALPSNLQQILESIKTIGSKADSSVDLTQDDVNAPDTIDLTIPLLLPKLSSRPLITGSATITSTIPLNLPKSRTKETDKSGSSAPPVSSTGGGSSSVLSSLSEEDLIRKAAEMLGETDPLPITQPPTPKRARLELSQPPIPGFDE